MCPIASPAEIEPDQLIPVAIESLYSSDGFEFDLYLKREVNDRPVLFRQHSFPCHSSDLDSLRERGIRSLQIPEASYQAYLDYLQNTLLASGTASPAAQLCALKELNREPFLEALQSIAPEKLVETAIGLGRQLATLVEGTETAGEDLFGVLDHDDSAFTHATNVCLYSVALAKSAGFRETTDMASIATGALLHDIGKRSISATTLNKPSRLTPHESHLVRRHPQSGFEELVGNAEITWPQLLMIYQHHERLDGCGYPVQVPGEDIHPWAKICAVANAFDTLTSQRPYRRARSTADASHYLREHSDTAFDRELVQCWTRQVKLIR